MSESESARDRYSRRMQELAADSRRLADRNGYFVLLRTILFFAAAILLCSGYIGAEPRGLLLTIGWASAALFLAAITAHELLRLTELTAQRQRKLYERLLARLDRRWDHLAAIPSGATERSALADDLDLFGSASLWQLLVLPSTGFGRQTLCNWLLNVPSWTQLIERQAAVKELRDAALPRERIIDLIATISDGADDATQLAHWAAGPRWLPRHRLAHILSYVGPLLVAVGVVALTLANMQSEPDVRALWLAVGLLGGGFAVNLLLTLGWGSWLHDIFLKVTGSNRDAQQLSAVFEEIGRLPGSSAIVVQLRERASQGDRSAVHGFQRLMWRVRMANLQRDPLFYIVYLVLQLALAWDFRVIESLERWQLQFGGAAPAWFEALGECEALIAGATLAEEYPQWCFPTPSTDPTVVFAVNQLGHPLLPDNQRVPNDVTLHREQPLLLVTGSNMAGKSTLLRALGLNQILARCGAPVCAQLYEGPLFELATSIRVRDSLKEGVSFFMAELKRLKQVVDIAERASVSEPLEGRERVSTANAINPSSPALPPVMFLLDEILQGTNSRERQIAVMKVVERLLECQAVGAISTHDLELADQATVQRVSQIVHFREYFDRSDGIERMHFDYQMRPGPTPTTNALKLLSLVGLVK